MLQWMGGSRRKVTTSKKSVQKRQKQYFEQRKRQQQYQQVASTEHVPDEGKGCQEKNNNNRSLDVLSLLNLSTVTQEANSCNPSDGERFSRDYQTTQSSPAVQSQTNEGNCVSLQLTEARMPSCHVAATTHRLKDSLSARGCQNQFSLENHKTLNNSKSITEHQLSVIDLIGDGPICKSNEVSSREDHVAFSIKGLGKVTTETPVHSPEQRVRTLSHGYASPSKTKRPSQVVKNFSSGLCTVDPEQDSMWDINSPFHADVMEQPFCSKSPGEYLSNGKSTFSTMKKLPQPYSNNCNSLDSRGDNDLFYHAIAKSHSFLPNILDEEEYSLCPETWVDPNNGFSDDYLSIRDPATQEFTNEGYYQDNSRRDFNATDLYCQPFSSESQTSYNTADEMWTSKFDGISGVSQVKATWPFFNDEDGVESFLSLSEESCRGARVRDSAIRPVFKSVENKSYRVNHRSPERCWKSSSKEQYISDNNSRYNEGRKNGSRVFSREAKSPSYAEIKIPNNKRLFREDYDDREIPNFNTFYCSPDTELVSPDGHLWTKDIFCMPPDLQPDIGFRSTARKSDASTYTSYSKFLPEDYNICKPLCDMKSHDILPDTASGNSKQKLCEDSKKCQKELLDGLDSLGSAESSDINGNTTTKSLLSDKGKHDLWSSKLNIPQDSMKDKKDWNSLHDISFLRLEKNSKQDLCKNTDSSPITNEKFNRQDVSGSNSFEVSNSSNPSGSEGKCSKYKSSTGRSPEKNTLKEVETMLDAEDQLSVVELSDISDDTESIPNKTVCKQDSNTQVPFQDKREEPEDSGVGEKKVAKTTDIHPTRQEVLLVEGCVLQLLRVQVVKDLSPDISQKKLSLLQRSMSS